MLFGALQGIVFGVVVLLSKKYRNRSIYFLIAIILAAVYNNLQYYISDINWIDMTTVWQTIYLPLGSLVPALIYFYVCTSIDDQKVITKIEKLLVLPFLFFFGVSTLYKLMNATDLINEENGLIFLALSNLHEVISFFFLIVVLIVSLRIIYRFKKSIKPYDHTYIQPRLNWLQGILLGLFFIALWYGYYIYMTYTNSNGFVNYYVVWILNSFLIYFLGHIGIYKFGIQEQRKKIRSFASDKKSYSISEKHKNEHAIALEQLVVGEKVYLNAEVTLEIVAEKLGLVKVCCLESSTQNLVRVFQIILIRFA